MPPSVGLPFDPVAEARRQWHAHGWTQAATGMAAVTSVMRVHQIFLTAADAVLSRFDLTFARYEVLTLLVFSSDGALPMGKVGARLQVHATSVTNAVDRLERQGYVERRAHPSDGRTTLAAVTEEGRAVAIDAGAALNEAVFSRLGLSERELDRLFVLLAKVRRSAGDFS